MLASNPRPLGSSALQFLTKHNKDWGKKQHDRSWISWLKASGNWTHCDCGEVSWSAKRNMAWYINDLSEEPLRYRTKVTYTEGVKAASPLVSILLICVLFFLVNIERTNWSLFMATMYNACCIYFFRMCVFTWFI